MLQCVEFDASRSYCAVPGTYFLDILPELTIDKFNHVILVFWSAVKKRRDNDHQRPRNDTEMLSSGIFLLNERN
jgi:hypothetical protein